jgi:hypothetical protein
MEQANVMWDLIKENGKENETKLESGILWLKHYKKND